MSERPYDDPKPKEDKYGMIKPKRKTPREIMQQTPPKQQDKPFTKAWDDLIKFGDCPICHGDPMRCPESDKPASACSRRRNAMKHSRGSVARRKGSGMFPRE